MSAGKSLNLFAILIMVLSMLAACGIDTPTPTPISQNDIKIIDISENKETTGQIVQTKYFDQCSAAGLVQAQIQFSKSNSESNQKELVLSGSLGGEAGVSAAAKVQVEASIQQHFSKVTTTEEDYREAIVIDIPARARQEYVITWREIRREGTITYAENNETKTANYSYRIGLEFVSSVARELKCDETPTPSPVPLSSTPSPIASTATPEPPSPIANGCISSKSWRADATDQVVLNGIVEQPNACYETGSLGISVNNSGVLSLLNQSKQKSLSAGIYTPIRNNSVIEFSIHVNSMYLVYAEPSVYISFAVAPLSAPMTAKNTARFKLQVEDTINSPLIYFVLADAGENAGVKINSQHYEYGRTYNIRFELAGSVMRLFINNIRQNENLSIPDGEKVFYIGYNLPTLAGIDAEVTNIKVDGVAR